jgi:hypothetical protein
MNGATRRFQLDSKLLLLLLLPRLSLLLLLLPLPRLLLLPLPLPRLLLLMWPSATGPQAGALIPAHAQEQFVCMCSTGAMYGVTTPLSCSQFGKARPALDFRWLAQHQSNCSSSLLQQACTHTFLHAANCRPHYCKTKVLFYIGYLNVGPVTILDSMSHPN